MPVYVLPCWHLNSNHTQWLWILICHTQMQIISHYVLYFLSQLISDSETLSQWWREIQPPSQWKNDSSVLGSPKMVLGTALPWAGVPGICLLWLPLCCSLSSPSGGLRRGKLCFCVRDLCQAVSLGLGIQYAWVPPNVPCPGDLGRSRVPGILPWPWWKNLFQFQHPFLPPGQGSCFYSHLQALSHPRPKWTILQNLCPRLF